jgi:ABC-type polysaccharide/polyol phosphate transport system ATPase subunit
VTAAVTLRNVSKVFVRRGNRVGDLKVRLLGLLHARHRERRETFRALDGVRLTVARGECLGVIGPNGSGKSTLLRLMAGIFPPTEGEVLVHGRVAPMIELGVGFHPDLTGAENVHLNTSLYGLLRRQTNAIFPLIVRFAELEEFVDVPVKNYSAGMYVRLGFSIAAHLDPDVLLVDEVLAVGDERFRQKCLERIAELRRRATTLVVVSHDLETVEQICDRACLLVRGRIEAEGPPSAVVKQYREQLAAWGASPRDGAHGPVPNR